MKKLLFQRFTKKTISCISALALLFTIISIIPTVAAIDVWDGSTDVAGVSYASGDGTKENPYIIKTGNQLYKMVAENTTYNAEADQLYFKMDNDIYLNNIEDSDWKDNSPKQWYNNTLKGNYKFTHVFDGAGHTIYGLYFNNTSSTDMIGFIPCISEGAWIRNVTLSDAYIKSGGRTGGITSRIHDTSTICKITACGITNSYIEGAGGSLYTGGFAAVTSAPTQIENCYVSNTEIKHAGATDRVAGFIADAYGAWVKINARNCYSQGVFPFVGQTSNTSYYLSQNVYTTITATTDFQKGVAGIKAVAENDLKGDTAKTTLSSFNFTDFWVANAGNYPSLVNNKGYGEHTEYEDSVNAVNKPWSGLFAKELPGKGTPDEPYLISTPGQLALIVENVVKNGVTYEGEHFKLTHNIYINDTSDPNWKENNPKNWYEGTAFGENGFRGHIDGDGHVIAGLYHKNTGPKNLFAGLFPVVGPGAKFERIGIIDSEIILRTDSTETFAGFFAGVLSSKAITGPETVTFSECFADSTTYVTAGKAAAFVGACPSNPVINIENCYYTGTLDRDDSDPVMKGTLVAHSWAYVAGNVKNTYIAPQVANCNILYSSNYSAIYTNCYTLSFEDNPGVVSLYDPNKLKGETAKNNLLGFDFDNVWVVRDGETPGLKAFENNSAVYSNAHHFVQLDEIHYTKFSFVTYTDYEVDPIYGELLQTINLPVLEDRKGYSFAGWFTSPTFALKYPLTVFPAYDMTLYAKWELTGIEQTFEEYPNTSYDVGDDYELYRMSSDNFSTDYVHIGARSLHRFGNLKEDADFLVAYEDELEVGKVYEMTFWATTDQTTAAPSVSIVHNTWPDIEEPIHSVEKPFKLLLKKGEWKQYTVTFTAQTKWISFRTSGGDSLFFDDIFLYATGKTGTILPAVKQEEVKEPVVEDLVDDTQIDDSVVELEPEEPEDITEEPEEEKKPTSNKKNNKNDKEEESNLLLYILIGVGAALIIAGAVVLIVLKVKKKK